MSFRPVFIALVLAGGLIIAAFVINSYRPREVVDQPTAALVKASGGCAQCHSNMQFSVVHEYELSKHAEMKVNCLQCHQPAEKQSGKDHHGYTISQKVTAANCRSCHEPIYQQFLRSRHAAPAWASVAGDADFTAEQVAFSEQFHPGSCKRPPHPLTQLEGPAATKSGCVSCHSIGKPNSDGTIGTCTACHTRHTSSVKVARLPTTCGQCHMGPDHSQLEIYTESKHGVLFEAQRHLLKMDVSPKALTTRDMFIPTCATCHMSGLNGMAVTHDPSDRLSYNLFAENANKRPNYARGQAAMKDMCRNCHTAGTIDNLYTAAEAVVATSNEKVAAAKSIMDGLRKDEIIGKKPFATPIDFIYFDLWHYYARTARHGAFMGGADFVQWHGNYPMLKHTVELDHMAKDLRRMHGK
ncbi:MAG TPA: multiheme c-type cytochrome [Gemmataceae bacterium]|nr:multiheme c-type cytochrome [Gemmataceae bacterium]